MTGSSLYRHNSIMLSDKGVVFTADIFLSKYCHMELLLISGVSEDGIFALVVRSDCIKSEMSLDIIDLNFSKAEWSKNAFFSNLISKNVEWAKIRLYSNLGNQVLMPSNNAFFRSLATGDSNAVTLSKQVFKPCIIGIILDDVTTFSALNSTFISLNGLRTVQISFKIPHSSADIGSIGL